MNKIPTAKDVLKKYYPDAFSEEDTLGFSLEQALLEFTKLHIQEFQKSELSFSDYLKTIK